MKAIAITRAATDGNNIEFLQEIDLPITLMCPACWVGTPLA